MKRESYDDSNAEAGADLIASIAVDVSQAARVSQRRIAELEEQVKDLQAEVKELQRQIEAMEAAE